MHPELFSVGSFTIHSYGFMIMLGAIFGYIFMSRFARKELNIDSERIQMLAIYIIVSAFVGGKLLFYLEDPGLYFGEPKYMVRDFRTGFVFYGSLLFAIPITIWFFKKEKWPLWPMLDLMAITGCIIHLFGRMGCFLAGCCYGLPSNQPWAVTFTDSASRAKPLHTALHPTQLYSVTLIGSIFILLVMLKRYDRLKGRLIFVYVSVYALGRSFIEMYRGDVRRGFVIEGILSHSQFISILILLTATIAYFVGYRKQKLS